MEQTAEAVIPTVFQSTKNYCANGGLPLWMMAELRGVQQEPCILDRMAGIRVLTKDLREEGVISSQNLMKHMVRIHKVFKNIDRKLFHIAKQSAAIAAVQYTGSAK